MRTTLRSLLLAVLLLVGPAWNAQAALQAVGPVSEANGFPVWYEDSNGLQLELCLDQNGLCLVEPPNPGEPIDFPENFGPEAFWWNAEVIGMPLTGGGSAELILAMEAAFAPSEEAVEGLQQAFARIRIRVDTPGPGTYRVSHPFGTAEYVITATGVTVRAINETQDIGNLQDPGRDGDFTLALADGPNPPLPGARVNADGRSIGPFLTPANNLFQPVAFIQRPEGTYIADPNQLTRVLGSPIPDPDHLSGFQNYFRVERNGVIIGESEFFGLMGKVAFCDPETNLPPVANLDFGAALGGAPVIINITTNDTDEAGVNPATVAIVTQGAKGTAVRHADGTVTYTPNAGASGQDTFTYTVQDFCGLPSNTATVTVLIEPAETLAAAQADYRSGLSKWLVRGTSTIHEPLVRLTGAGEVPPVTTGARGFARINVNPAGDAISYSLMIDAAPATAIEQAHIHVGAPDVNGPVIFFLCSNLAPPAGVPAPPLCPEFTGVVEGTLTASHLIPREAQGVNTFADALAALRGGNTYVNAHTVANPGGEIRGQIGNFVTLRTGAAGTSPVGTAVVQPGGAWLFDGKSAASPGASPRTVQGISTTGATTTIPLRLR